MSSGSHRPFGRADCGLPTAPRAEDSCAWASTSTVGARMFCLGVCILYLTFGQAQDRWPVPAELRHGDAWSRDVAPEEQTRRVQEAKQALKRVKGEQIGHDCVRKWGKACVGHQG